MLGFVPLRSVDELSKDSTSNSQIIETKEAIQNKWFEYYNATLKKHRSATTISAKREVISNYLELIPGESSRQVELSATMHFSVLKNLAVLQEEVGDIESSIKSFAAATDVDNTDVSLWYISLISNYALKLYQLYIYILSIT